MRRVVEQVDQQTPGCCEVFVGLLRACGMFCYIACPPVPSAITRKLAFHPPRKGMTYRIQLKSDPNKVIKNISQVNDDEYQIIIRSLTSHTDHVPNEADVQTFKVITEHKNHLVCVRCPTPVISHVESPLSKQVILFCQPNSSDLGGFLQPQMMNLTNYADIFGVDLYAFDYSGYGYSSGTQGEKKLYADVRAVYDYIRATQPDKHIVLMGYSIGTTAVIDLASTNPEGLVGVVLIAPFTSGLRLVSHQPTKPETCWADAFTSYDKIGNIQTKVLICHGDIDEVIPISHGLALFEKLQNPAPPTVVHGANHHTILSGRYLQTFDRIARFLQTETEIVRKISDSSQASE